MDLIAWKRVLDERTMSGYSNCIEYLIERQSTFAMWKFAACVSELLIGCNLQHTGHHTGHQNRDHCGHTAHYQARHDPAHQKGLFILIFRHSIAYLHRD